MLERMDRRLDGSEPLTPLYLQPLRRERFSPAVQQHARNARLPLAGTPNRHWPL